MGETIPLYDYTMLPGKSTLYFPCIAFSLPSRCASVNQIPT